MAGDITNIMYRCYPILPVVYDESLSYYEVLCKVSAKGLCGSGDCET